MQCCRARGAVQASKARSMRTTVGQRSLVRMWNRPTWNECIIDPYNLISSLSCQVMSLRILVPTNWGLRSCSKWQLNQFHFLVYLYIWHFELLWNSVGASCPLHALHSIALVVVTVLAIVIAIGRWSALLCLPPCLLFISQCNWLASLERI
jgi:hypothetical protein